MINEYVLYFIGECDEHEFQCETDVIVSCVPDHKVCDSVPDCIDGSDESYDVCGKCVENLWSNV